MLKYLYANFFDQIRTSPPPHPWGFWGAFRLKKSPGTIPLTLRFRGGT